MTGPDLTLLPGLIDSHTHTWHDFVLTDALRFGVTTTIDMVTPVPVATRLREEQRQGSVYHRADMLSAGAAATVPGGHGARGGSAVPTISTPEQAPDFVNRRVEEGSDFIKIILEPGVGRLEAIPTLDRDTLHALVGAAHHCGKIAVAHALSRECALEAIRAGVDGLAHSIMEGQPDEELVGEASRRGIFLIPTLTAIEGALATGAGAELASHPVLGVLLSPYWREHLASSSRALPTAPLRFEIACSFARQAFLQGVPILAGTDTPNPGTAAGASLHRELELLVACGQAPLEALRAATSVPATRFGLMDRGRILPGLRSDLLLVTGDPSLDILATRQVAGVWKHGRLYSSNASSLV
ncbi:MAG: amidohydrolase family protein [Bryobacterales bacterium]|nr:amidohydrolase family protein [Bryobacterales bacterium]